MGGPGSVSAPPALASPNARRTDVSNGSALCIECGERPRYGTYQRCWACHCADNAKRPCVECGEPRWKAHKRCREHQLALRNVQQRERYASDESHRITVREQQRRWLADHPEFRKRRQGIINERRKERYAAEPEYRVRVLALAAAGRYNLTFDQYLAMIARGCDACGGRDNLHIDHDHKCCPGNTSCGKCVRGVLCDGCNIALGYLDDDPERVKKLLHYIGKYQHRSAGTSPS